MGRPFDLVPLSDRFVPEVRPLVDAGGGRDVRAGSDAACRKMLRVWSGFPIGDHGQFGERYVVFLKRPQRFCRHVRDRPVRKSEMNAFLGQVTRDPAGSSGPRTSPWREEDRTGPIFQSALAIDGDHAAQARHRTRRRGATTAARSERYLAKTSGGPRRAERLCWLFHIPIERTSPDAVRRARPVGEAVPFHLVGHDFRGRSVATGLDFAAV